MRLWYVALLLPLVAATIPRGFNEVSSEGVNIAAVIEKPPTSEVDDARDKGSTESSEEGMNSDEVNQEFEEYPDSSPEELSEQEERDESSVPALPIESQRSAESAGNEQETTHEKAVEREEGKEEVEETEEHPEMEDWSSEENGDAEIKSPENGGEEASTPAVDDSKISADTSVEQNQKTDSEVGKETKEDALIEETEEQPEVEDWSSEESDDVETKPTENEESEERVEEQPEFSDEDSDAEVNKNRDEATNAGEEKLSEHELSGSEEIEETAELEDKSSEEAEEQKENNNEEETTSAAENEKDAQENISDSEEIEEAEEKEEEEEEDNGEEEGVQQDIGIEQEGVEQETTEEKNITNETENQAEAVEETTNDGETGTVGTEVNAPENLPNDDYDVREKIVDQALKAFAELVKNENGEVEESEPTSDTPVEEVAAETNAADATDSAKEPVAEVNAPRSMNHADIRAAIIAEAEKAFKIVIQEEEKIDVAKELRDEPKLAESEEKEIKQLMSNAFGEKEEAIVEKEEKAEEDEIVKNLTRRRRAAKEQSPVELPMETTDETGKNETLPVAIEKDAPRVETKRQETARAKFTDGLGWVHYPWKAYPILKKTFHHDRQCGCEVMWIKRVYTRHTPKSKLVLVKSISLSHHRCRFPTRTQARIAHAVKRPLKATKPCKRRYTKGRHTVSRLLAEHSWANHITKKKSAAREGRLAYDKRQKHITRGRRCNKNKRH